LVVELTVVRSGTKKIRRKRIEMDSLATRVKRKLWTRVFGTEAWIKKTGDFRTRESYGLISRPYYIYGMLRAADNAKYFGKKAVTVVEMGVASGRGLLNMIDCAELVTKETGVFFRIVGFDSGSGLPSIQGHKDHPELWNPGDFTMENRGSLLETINGRAEIIWGDIEKTIGPFAAAIDPSSPLGFISVDVDIYSATRAGLRCLTGDFEKYLPAVSMYFDDVSFFFANKWCGELAAIDEFNSENEMRKIGNDRSLPGQRPIPAASWYRAMHVCHILDHPDRQVPRKRCELPIAEHHRFMKAANL
jgi:hypothetical protein